MNNKSFFRALATIQSRKPQDPQAISLLTTKLHLDQFFNSVEFDSPSTQGEPKFPLGGILMEPKVSLKVKKIEILNYFGKNTESSDDYLSYDFKNKFCVGVITFYFSKISDDVTFVAIHWSYRNHS